jgi:broad specificity phosphatase PhoE
VKRFCFNGCWQFAFNPVPLWFFPWRALPLPLFFMKLYFVRHGESEANLLHEISNRGQKHGLTPQGREQGATLASRLASCNITQLFTSPLLRATQTADILADALGLPYQITDALREYDCGMLEGNSDDATWERYRQLRRDWIDHHHWEARIEQGESFHDMQQRFVPFIQPLLQQTDSSTGAIVFIGHGGLYACMLPLILQNVSFAMAATYPFPNTAYVFAESRNRILVGLEWCGISLAETDETTTHGSHSRR